MCDQGYSSSCPGHLVSERPPRWARAQTARQHQGTQNLPASPARLLVGRRVSHLHAHSACELRSGVPWPRAKAPCLQPAPSLSAQASATSLGTFTTRRWHKPLLGTVGTCSGTFCLKHDASVCSAARTKCPDRDLSNRSSLPRVLQSGSPGWECQWGRCPARLSRWAPGSRVSLLTAHYPTAVSTASGSRHCCTGRTLQQSAFLSVT